MRVCKKIVFLFVLCCLPLKNYAQSLACQNFFSPPGIPGQHELSFDLHSLLTAMESVVIPENITFSENLRPRGVLFKNVRSYSDISKSGIKYINFKFQFDIESFKKEDLTPEFIHNYINQFLKSEISAKAKKAILKSKYLTYDLAYERLMELQKIKFLYILIKNKGSFKNPQEFNALKKTMSEVHIKSYLLNNLVQVINVPSIYFTRRSFSDFYGTRRFENGRQYKGSIPHFIATLLEKEKVDWNEVSRLTQLLRASNESETFLSTNELSDEVKINPFELKDILRGVVEPNSTEIKRLKSWINGQIAKYTESSVELNLESKVKSKRALKANKINQGKTSVLVRGRKPLEDFSETVKSKKENLTPNKAIKKTEVNLDSESEIKNEKAQEVNPSENIFTDNYFEKYGWKNTLNFGHFIVNKIEGAYEFSGMKSLKVRNHFGITTTLWHKWKNQEHLPMDYAELKLLSHVLESLKNKNVPRVSLRKKWKKRKLNGSVKTVSVDEYIKENQEGK